MTKKITSFRMEPDVMDRLRVYSRLTGQSQAKLIESALRRLFSEIDLAPHLAELDDAARRLTG